MNQTPKLGKPISEADIKNWDIAGNPPSRVGALTQPGGHPP
jgi:hypothetical protein